MKLNYRLIAAGLIVALAVPLTQVAAAPKDKKQGKIAGCPPGLAKKNPPCVPPGQVGKQYPGVYRIGDRIERDYVVIGNPGRYGLDPNQTYYRVGDNIFRVNRQTREILEFIGAAANLLD